MGEKGGQEGLRRGRSQLQRRGQHCGQSRQDGRPAQALSPSRQCGLRVHGPVTPPCAANQVRSLPLSPRILPKPPGSPVLSKPGLTTGLFFRQTLTTISLANDSRLSIITPLTPPSPPSERCIP